MPNKKLLIFLSLLVLIVFSVYFFEKGIQCEGCGGCSYEAGQRIVYIKEFKMEDGAVKEVKFQNTLNSKDNFWYARDFELKNKNIHLDSSTVADTTIRYILDGEFIKHGTCVPFQFKNLTRIPSTE
jgi:AAA15 family ATPase/GTPase